MKKLFLITLFLGALITNCFCLRTYELSEGERKKAYEKWIMRDDIMIIQKDAFMTNVGEDYFVKIYNHIASYNFQLTNSQIRNLKGNGVYFTPGLAECRIVEHSKKIKKLVRIELRKPWTDYIVDDYWMCSDWIETIEEYNERFM